MALCQYEGMEVKNDRKIIVKGVVICQKECVGGQEIALRQKQRSGQIHQQCHQVYMDGEAEIKMERRKYGEQQELDSQVEYERELNERSTVWGQTGGEDFDMRKPCVRRV